MSEFGLATLVIQSLNQTKHWLSNHFSYERTMSKPILKVKTHFLLVHIETFVLTRSLAELVRQKVVGLARIFCSLHELFCLEKTLQMPHLPGSHYHKYASLSQGPPQNSLIGTFAGLSKSLLSVSLIVLLLGDLLHLVKQLPHPQLKLREFLFLGHVGIVNGVLSNLNI